MEDHEFALSVPPNVVLPIVLPSTKPATKANLSLVDIYNRIAEYANEGLRLASEGYARDYCFVVTNDGAIKALKATIEKICYEVRDLVVKEEEVFEAPDELVKVLGFLEIKATSPGRRGSQLRL